MQNYICLAAIGLAFLATGAEAESLRSYGFAAGLSYAGQTIHGEYAEYDPDYAWGGVGGLSFEWQTFGTRPASLRTELFFVQKGHTDHLLFADGGPRSNTSTSRVNYLSLPLLLAIIGRGPGVTPYLMVGPSLEIKLNHSAQEQNRLDDLALGGIVGFGLSSGRHSPAPTFEIRYAMDISDSADDPLPPYGRGPGRNRAVLLLGGLRFR